MADGEGAGIAVAAHDWRHYAEKLRRAEHDLDEAYALYRQRIETSGAVIAAVAMASTGIASWAVTAPIWFVIGAGMTLIVTPTGRVIR